ncbi:MAG: SUMF1/EgtB/PvdO family nonheme iron enzyme [Candidatus Poribacteria bacterium]
MKLSNFTNIAFILLLAIFFFGCGKEEPIKNDLSFSPSFTVSPNRGDLETIFTFDASSSNMNSDLPLLFRWDWESDGKWDTNFSSEPIATHRYDSLGYKTVTLEVKNDIGTSTTQREILITVASNEMIRIPEGEFVMGSPDGIGNDDEHPQHKVYLDEFYIGKYEVTNEQYAEFLTQLGKITDDKGNILINLIIASIRKEGQTYRAKKGWEDHPVIGVSWYGAKAYAEFNGGRLPTEAEWEKSARGTDGRIWPWGNVWNKDFCNSWELEPHQTRSVGSFPKGTSFYGLQDMAGNVFEWVADWYQPDYYKNSPSKNPKGPESGGFKVMRGGGWPELSDEVRSAFRFGGPPESTDSRTGFRIAKDF